MRWDDPRDSTPRRWLRPAGEDPHRTIEDDRRTVRSMRGLVRSMTTDANVGMLTDAEVVDLVTSLPDSVLATAPPEVRVADDLVGGASDGSVAGDAATFDKEAWLDEAKEVSALESTTDFAREAVESSTVAENAAADALATADLALASEYAAKAKRAAWQSAEATKSAFAAADTAPADDQTAATNIANRGQAAATRAENAARDAEAHVAALQASLGT